jgi:hypothetical protein
LPVDDLDNITFYLENKESGILYATKLAEGNTIYLPQMKEYPTYFNILDFNRNSLFSSIFIAKDGYFTNAALYTSMSETYLSI